MTVTIYKYNIWKYKRINKYSFHLFYYTYSHSTFWRKLIKLPLILNLNYKKKLYSIVRLNIYFLLMLVIKDFIANSTSIYLIKLWSPKHRVTFPIGAVRFNVGLLWMLDCFQGIISVIPTSALTYLTDGALLLGQESLSVFAVT